MNEPKTEKRVQYPSMKKDPYIDLVLTTAEAVAPDPLEPSADQKARGITAEMLRGIEASKYFKPSYTGDAAEDPKVDEVDAPKAPSAPVTVRLYYRRVLPSVKARWAARQSRVAQEERKRLAELRKGLTKEQAPELWPHPLLDVDQKPVFRLDPVLVDERKQPARIPVMIQPEPTPEMTASNFDAAIDLIRDAFVRLEGLNFEDVRSEDVDPATEPELIAAMLDQIGAFRDAIQGVTAGQQMSGKQLFSSGSS